MKKNIVILIGIIIFSLFQVVSSSATVHAATFQDGTYDVPFSLKEAGSDSASIADGYFSKPAKLVVKNGVYHIQLTTSESDWVKSISGPKGSATDVGSNGNSRTVQFEVGDLSSAVNLQMHVVVPEEVAGMEYDHNHTVRAIFDVSNVPVASGESAPTDQQDTTTESSEVTAGTTDSVDNPKTGDSSPIGVYVFLLLSSVAVLVIYETRVSKNRGEL